MIVSHEIIPSIYIPTLIQTVHARYSTTGRQDFRGSNNMRPYLDTWVDHVFRLPKPLIYRLVDYKKCLFHWSLEAPFRARMKVRTSSMQAR
jgi:hypothetical protein